MGACTFCTVSVRVFIIQYHPELHKQHLLIIKRCVEVLNLKNWYFYFYFVLSIVVAIDGRHSKAARVLCRLINVLVSY